MTKPKVKPVVVDDTPVDNGMALVQAARRINDLNKRNTTLVRENQQLHKRVSEVEVKADYMKVINRDWIEAHNWEKLKPSGNSTAILVLSDWHYEERVDPATVGKKNCYTPAIASKRVKNVFQKTVELVEAFRHLTEIDELVIAVLGDMITGYIHEELVESNWLSPTEACLEVQDLLVSGIDFLQKELKPKSIIIPTAFGNHGRTTAKSRISTGYANSYEWLMYQQLAWHYEKIGSPIRWKVGRGYHNVLNVQGHKVRFHHGDAIRYSGGVGGITIPVNKAIAAWNKAERADLDVFGHYHTSKDDAWWVSNGSLMGYNPFSVAIKAEYETPSQSLILVNAKRGKIISTRVFGED